MIKILASIVVLLLSQVVNALEPAEVSVKIRSGLCAYGSPVFSGSGFLFKEGAKTFVITSEHVVLHSNGEYCHEIAHPRLGRVKAALVDADWGRGLAILEVSGSSRLHQVAVTLDDIESGEPDVDQSVTLSGFPIRSSKLLKDASGKILVPHSDRQPFALDVDAFELSGHGERGMSGGAVFSEDGRRIVGLLSHQFVQLVVGSASTLGDLESSQIATEYAQLENHLIALRGSTIRRYVQDVLSEGRRSAFSLSTLGQMKGENSVMLGGLRFSLESAQPDGTIGGGDGGGIGGGDGGGIGGSESTARISGKNVIRVTLGDGVRLESESESDIAWLNDLRARLLRRDEVAVVGLVKDSKRAGIDSLARFFKDAQSGARLLLESKSRFKIPGRVESSRGHIALRDQLAGPIKTLRQKSLSASALLLLSQLEVAGQLLSQGDLPDETLLAGISGSSAWQELFVSEFDSAVMLKTSWLQCVAGH